MHLVRFERGGVIGHGILEGDRIAQIAGGFFGDLQRTGESAALADVTLKAPSSPTKIINLAGNYQSHIGGRAPSPRPQPFLAPPSSVQDPGGPVVIPAGDPNTHYEGEMAVIIGKRCARVSEAEAPAYVLGVCAANDISARSWQGGADKDVQWWRGKGADTFSPFGPWITTGLDYNNLDLVTRLNGEVVQDTNTSQLIHGVDAIIAFVSAVMTLEPGDAIFTGTSGTTRMMSPGDVVEVELEGNGTLRNPVVADT